MSSELQIVLHGVTLLSGDTADIALAQGKIAAVSGRIQNRAATTIHLENALAFPGLINSHDHLEFNLFPQCGHRRYRNYMEWGPDIHVQDADIIRSVLKIPKSLRAQWGLYKNLLAGVTTVVHHGGRLPVTDALIEVVTKCRSLHSVQLEQHWKWKLANPLLPDYPLVIHTGEGTDKAAHDEINKLIRWNVLSRRLIGVHAVAMDIMQARQFKALVWCPDANFFLLGATAAITELQKATTILFGTDATISADWNIWNQLRLARKTGMLSDEALLNAVSKFPADVWELPLKGAIREGCEADIVVAKKNAHSATATENFFETNPEDLLLVISRGAIVLFDESLQAQLQHLVNAPYSRIRIAGKGKFVKGDLARLIKEIKQFHPPAVFPVHVE